jgi:hypothetical protein
MGWEWREAEIRPLLILLAVAVLSVGVCACGSTGKNRHLASHRLSSANESSVTPTQLPVEHSPQGYLNDGDHDRVGDEDGDNNNDVDNDAPWDYKPANHENGRYHDSDDRSVLTYGRAASIADRLSISALVTRYYVAASRSDGQGGCSMLPSNLVRAIPGDYGELGPSYLRGGRTCVVVLTTLFKHFHGELIAPIKVTSVRVAGDHAYALLASATLPASYVTLQREGAVWRINELLGNQLA